MAPGSSPPCPASIAMTISRLLLGNGGSLIAGRVGDTGAVGVLGVVVAGTLAVDAAAASAALSNRSTTSRWPYCWFGVSVKLFGETSELKSMTTRKVSASYFAARNPEMGVFCSGS